MQGSSDAKTVCDSSSIYLTFEMLICAFVLQGTAFFMAVELMGQEPFYVPTWPGQKMNLFELDSKASVFPHFHHNFQHDVESFFWLFLWMLIGRVDDENLHDYSKFIFQNSLNSCPYRRRVIRQSTAELQYLRSIFPQEMQFLLQHIWDFARGLHEAYLDRQDKFELLTTYCGIIYQGYEALKLSLDRIRETEIPMLNNLKVYTTPGDAGLSIAPRPPAPDDVPKHVPMKTLPTWHPAVADGDYKPSKPSRSTKRARREQ
jgi:hypothetical protein